MITDMGYILLETHPRHPGQLHCVPLQSLPDVKTAEFGAKVRYIARYGNLFRGYQQLQSALCKHRINIDEGIYGVDLVEAIAALETAPYGASRIWIDPHLREDRKRQLQECIETCKAHNLRVDTLWHRIGFAFIGFLLLRVFGFI